jgi:NAD(P)-dependent dehydrogenase (short-subunit alcohol dehydrogenase family)
MQDELEPLEPTLKGRTVVVTGGARRLGRAIALECARRGANVAITFRHSGREAQQTLEELRAIGQATHFEAYELEVTDADAITRLAGDIEVDFGGASDLVNSAAIFERTPFEKLSAADFDAHIGANLRGPFLLCLAFAPQLRAWCERGGPGANIVNIGDIHGLRPLKNYAPYCVSKAGLLMLTQVLALDLAPHIRVNAVCPGTILVPSTEQGENDSVESLVPKIPLGRLGEPSDIARTVAFLLTSPFASGVILPIDGAQRLR